MKYGLLGETLGHSFSPQLHAALGGYEYGLLPTAPEDVPRLLSKRDFLGLNVTIPYKQTVIPLCDEVDGRALAIGAVNTIVNRDGRLYGYNTDIDGLLYMAKRQGISFAGKKVLILGSGGTSRTARAAAELSGAREIRVVSRRGGDNYENITRHDDAEVIINTTPVGMHPHEGASLLSLERFPALTGVLDVVYNPLRTALVLNAERRGIPCSGGLPMLATQARRASELFTGESISDEKMETVLRELTASLTNLVLIGMPGCGKTTLGKALAHKLSRPFVDSDTLVQERCGKSIPAIFTEDGENAFREAEAACLRELGTQHGLVISTGGGAVIREENYAPLHQNGKVFHIRRDISRLAKEGRPLSLSNDPEQLWASRKSQYQQFADREINNNGTVEETLAALLKEVEAL